MVGWYVITYPVQSASITRSLRTRFFCVSSYTQHLSAIILYFAGKYSTHRENVAPRLQNIETHFPGAHVNSLLSLLHPAPDVNVACLTSSAVIVFCSGRSPEAFPSDCFSVVLCFTVVFPLVLPLSQGFKTA